MRGIATTWLALALAACSSTAKDGTPIVREGPLPGDGTLTGTISELSNPGSTFKKREAEDNLRCQQLGFKASSEAFSNCRLQLQKDRKADRRAFQARRAEEDDTTMGGTPVYSARADSS